jgi:hypothetical protein
MEPSIKVCLVACLLAACGARESEDEGLRATPLAAAPPVESVTGYTHKAEVSRFRLGDFVEERSEFGLHKIVGKEGVFAVDERNGSSLGVPNGDAPALLRPPLTDDADVHNQRVLGYFKGAGLPPDQVSGVHVTASMRGVAHSVDEPPEVAGASGGTLEGFQSVVERSIEGIPVPDSFAWARFNADDEVVWENVHWPPIPRSAINDAHALQAALGSEAFRDTLAKATGIADASKLKVAIHHSSFAVEGPVAVLASVDVIVGGVGSKPRAAHFDVGGREVRLPKEATSRAQWTK